jgi:predicted protein tyrosine phosphatase
MEPHHAAEVEGEFPWAADKIKVLNIPDQFLYRDPKLIDLLEKMFAKEIKEAQKHG